MKKYVLLIDDPGLPRDLLQTALQGIGVDVSPVQNGIEVMQELKKQPITLLIICDTNSSMNRLAMLKEVRTNAAFTSLPVLVVGQAGNQQFKLDLESLGIDVELKTGGSLRRVMAEVSKIIKFPNSNKNGVVFLEGINSCQKQY